MISLRETANKKRLNKLSKLINFHNKKVTSQIMSSNINDSAAIKIKKLKLITSASKSDLNSSPSSNKPKVKLHRVLSSGHLEREIQEQILHESMLKRELNKFRRKVEEKFHKSISNHAYVFPRNDPIDSEFVISKIDCISLLNHSCCIACKCK